MILKVFVSVVVVVFHSKNNIFYFKKKNFYIRVSKWLKNIKKILIKKINFFKIFLKHQNKKLLWLFYSCLWTSFGRKKLIKWSTVDSWFFIDIVGIYKGNYIRMLHKQNIWKSDPPPMHAYSCSRNARKQTAEQR